MTIIDEETVIDFYLDLLKEDEVSFLQGKEEKKGLIREKMMELRDRQELHDQIEVARELWKLLFESSMVYIDPNKQGYDDLFDYFDEFVEFEELIFASDAFYRDHTLHSLWVYFLGEYIFRKEEFQPLFVQYQSEIRYYKELGGLLKEPESKTLTHIAGIMDQFTRIIEYDDSIRCVMSLAHDLGYPLKKITTINESISQILPYYSITRFGEFEFQFEEVQNIYVEKFLETISFNLSTTEPSADISDLFQENELLQKFMELSNKYAKSSMDGRSHRYRDEILEVVSQFGKEEKRVLEEYLSPTLEIIRDHSRFMRFSSDFENYRHGIMSAYLLTKTVKAFSDMKISYNETGKLKNQPSRLPTILSKLNILEGMADHTSEGFTITGFEESAPLLVLVDEIEEFSRISRAAQNRQYVNQFCETDLGFEDGFMTINFIFENEEIGVLDPELFFKDKCKRLLTVFDLPNLASYLNIKFRCTSELSEEKEVYELTLSRDTAEIKVNQEHKEIKEYLESKEFEY